ncbi:MAG: hypothetical protein LBC97_04780 [Bifidobacteriaceae bacterium]|jgi:hypothetical protein|nr:hypothetical protein [Bifidobacteriaceae bacterium]
MTTLSATQINRFLDACRTLLPDPAEWPKLNSYPDSLAESVIDAIWSEQVRYSNVIEIVGRYRDYRRAQGADADHDGARELAATFSIGLDAWIDQIGNRQRVFSRDNAPYKAQVVQQAADAAVASGVQSVADLQTACAGDTDQYQDFHRRWLALPAQSSGMSWERLGLAAGIETVPRNLWLVEFATHATGAPVSGADAVSLVDAAANTMSVTPLRLRNAIWLYQTKADRAARSGSAGPESGAA